MWLKRLLKIAKIMCLKRKNKNMNRKIFTALSVLIIVLVSSFGCKNSTKTKDETRDVNFTWMHYTLRISDVRELSDSVKKVGPRLIEVGLSYVSDSDNRTGILKTDVEERYRNFVLTDSKGSTYEPLSEWVYKLDKIAFDPGAGGFVEKLHYFALKYDIPENIPVSDLSLKANEQVIQINKYIK
jgi:hypothetical protein